MFLSSFGFRSSTSDPIFLRIHFLFWIRFQFTDAVLLSSPYCKQIGPSSYLSRDLGELTDSGGVQVPDLGQHVVVGEADVQLLLLLHHFPLHKLILVILDFGGKSRRKSMKLRR